MKGLVWDEENRESRKDFYKEIKWIAKTRRVPESSIELDVNHPVGEVVIFIDGVYWGYLDTSFYDFMEYGIDEYGYYGDWIK